MEYTFATLWANVVLKKSQSIIWSSVCIVNL